METKGGYVVVYIGAYSGTIAYSDGKDQSLSAKVYGTTFLNSLSNIIMYAWFRKVFIIMYTNLNYRVFWVPFRLVMVLKQICRLRSRPEIL